MTENVVRRSVVYCARKPSPSCRARSALPTSFLLRSRRACMAVNCCCRLACSRARSSGEPPHGLNASSAATILATNKTPSPARTSTRGSLRFRCEPPVSKRGDTLKALGIIHTQTAAIELVGLGRRQGAMRIHRAESRRALQIFQELDYRLERFRADVHIQRDLVLADHRGAYRHDTHVVRHDLFQVGEDLRPADAFAIQQGIEKHATLEDLGVFGLAQDGIL